MFDFRKLVMSRYEVVAIDSPPAPDYPPASVRMAINVCKAKGREDLAQKILNRWVLKFNECPPDKRSWGSLVNRSQASISLHIFEVSLKKGMEFGVVFSEWFDKQVPLSQEEKEKIVHIPHNPELAHTPKIAIAEDESFDSWQKAAEQTRAIIIQARKGFAEATQFIDYYAKQADEIRRKIAEYSVAKTKDGKSHKLKERVPKWTMEVKVIEEELSKEQAILAQQAQEMKTNEQRFIQAVDAYNAAPITAVPYEAKVQDSLSGILDYILSIKDDTKQKDLLDKFNAMLERKKEVGAEAVEAGVGSKISSVWKFVKKSWDELVLKLKGLTSAVSRFEHLANIR